jgi:glucose dehydrogenase
MEKDRYLYSDLKRKQKIVMYTVAYVDTLIYAILLWSVVMQYENFTNINMLILIFGIGALISTVASSIIIRNHYTNERPFVKTLISLAIAHVPSVTGLLLSIILLSDSM